MIDLQTLTIQSFDDDKKRNSKSLAQIFPCNATGSKERIKELQSKGAGIFFAVNPQEDGLTRGIDHTTQLVRLALDLDVCKEVEGLTEEDRLQRKREVGKKLKGLSIPPGDVIITKNGLQPVWTFNNPRELKTIIERREANELYRSMVLGVCEKLRLNSEGDNISRVLRLPGSKHQKSSNDAFTIEIKPFSDHNPRIEEFIQAYPLIEANKTTKTLKDLAGGVTEGSRNVSAVTYLGKLLKIHSPQDWESIVWPMLKGFDLQCTPPQGEQVMRSMFERITAAELSKVQSIGHIDLLEKFKTEQKEIRFKLNSGYESLDKSIDGFRSGALYVFAGLKKSGKSSLLMNILANFLRDNIQVGFINTELLYSQFINRFVAISENLPVKQIENQEEISEKWLEENQGLLSYCDKSTISSQLGLSKELLKGILSSWAAKGVKVVCFDNITTFGTETLADKQGWQILADLVDELVDFAKENKIVVFAVIHTKPAVIFTETPAGVRTLLEEERLEDVFKKSITTNRRPTAADLYGGGSALSQISGGVLLLWRPFQDFKLQIYKEMALLILEDFRDGAKLSEIEMRFEMEKLKFSEVYSVDINFPKKMEFRRNPIEESEVQSDLPF